MNETLINDLQELEAKGLRRGLRLMEGPQAKAVIIDGKEVLNFCSNDYLGLANDPRLAQAAVEAMGRWGFGAGASRLVCGGMTPHEELEADLARSKGTDAGLLFNSGYAANTGIIAALIGRADRILCDRLNHASIIDGAILSRADLQRYSHLDMEALHEGLKQTKPGQRTLIVTDSVFSMDGDTAPLKDIIDLARRYGAWVMVDEAHGFGVLGERGGGLAEEMGIASGIDIQMGTLSKAAGCFGAYACGSAQLREHLVNHARSFIYSTALPPAVAAAARRAVAIIRDPGEGGRLRKALRERAQYVRDGLKSLGFDTLNSSTPIIPIVVKEAPTAQAMSKRLLELGIFVQAIRPPTVPANTARLRVTVTAAHTREDLDRFLNTLKSL